MARNNKAAVVHLMVNDAIKAMQEADDADAESVERGRVLLREADQRKAKSDAAVRKLQVEAAVMIKKSMDLAEAAEAQYAKDRMAADEVFRQVVEDAAITSTEVRMITEKATQ